MTEITLSGGEVILVDAETAEKVGDKTWRMSQGGSVYHAFWDKEAKKTRAASLVPLITGEAAPKGYVWTHANGNRMDFRRENLVLVQRGKHHSAIGGMTDLERRGRAIQSVAGKFVGVQAYGNRFRAKISANGKQRHLGSFLTEEAAARAYDDALVELGYSAVNFPDGNAPSRPLSFDERLDEIRIRGDRGGLKALLREKLTQRQKQAALHLAAEWL
ncbi:HNH endonuclease [Deinococcus sp. VB343]|uniref:HNH endonuclease n=1 Tax=Deinococcus sp. VB343 TaxID=3385567 RepID=UPI0039C90A58